MAETALGRRYKRKRIKCPTDPDNSFVDIPCIYEASFKSMQDQAQEFVMFFDNGPDTAREVHTKTVSNNADGSMTVDVERIEQFTVKTMAEQAQEVVFHLLTGDPPPKQANGADDPAHQKVHYVRYYQPENTENWVDVELIDEIKISCAAEQYQEWHWYLQHPEIGNPVSDASDPFSPTFASCPPYLELDESVGSPYRLDPWQNIVNVHWGETGTGLTSLLVISVFDPVWLVWSEVGWGKIPDTPGYIEASKLDAIGIDTGLVNYWLLQDYFSKLSETQYYYQYGHLLEAPFSFDELHTEINSLCGDAAAVEELYLAHYSEFPRPWARGNSPPGGPWLGVEVDWTIPSPDFQPYVPYYPPEFAP